MKEQCLFIDGQWVQTGVWRDVRSPYDGALIGRSAIGSIEHAVTAVDAAARALRSAPAAHARAEMLSRLADIIDDNAEELAKLICAEAGKPISAARVEVQRASMTFRLSGEAARTIGGEVLDMEAIPNADGLLGFTMPRPRGIVAAITPFNFPLNLVAHKVGPAVAAGCAVVLKPSERTPLIAGRLVELTREVGFPRGLVNLVTGEPAAIVESWLDHPEVAVMTFTGSAQIGWSLKERSPRKKHVLELGSNTAMIVADDADLDAAAEAIVSSGFGFAGQACISLQRVYVVRKVAAELVRLVATRTEQLVVGDPADPSTDVGPLISADAVARVDTWVREAVESGAEVVVGGAIHGASYRPTILFGVPSGCRVLDEEVFGPVVCINPIESVAAAVEQVNGSRFGLHASLFTASLDSALNFAKTADVGGCLVNVSPSFRGDHMPYGGRKDSGEGLEGVKYAIQELQEHTLVVLASAQHV